MMVWKMIFLFNWVAFRFHVNLPGCNPFHFRWVFYSPWAMQCSKFRPHKQVIDTDCTFCWLIEPEKTDSNNMVRRELILLLVGNSWNKKGMKMDINLLCNLCKYLFPDSIHLGGEKRGKTWNNPGVVGHKESWKGPGWIFVESLENFFQTYKHGWQCFSLDASYWSKTCDHQINHWVDLQVSVGLSCGRKWYFCWVSWVWHTTW